MLKTAHLLELVISTIGQSTEYCWTLPTSWGEEDRCQVHSQCKTAKQVTLELGDSPLKWEDVSEEGHNHRFEVHSLKYIARCPIAQEAGGHRSVSGDARMHYDHDVGVDLARAFRKPTGGVISILCGLFMRWPRR